MAPKKTAGAAKENVSLGPLAGDGMYNPVHASRIIRFETMSNLRLNCRQARFRCCPYLCLLQRYLRPRHRSEVRHILKYPNIDCTKLRLPFSGEHFAPRNGLGVGYRELSHRLWRRIQLAN